MIIILSVIIALIPAAAILYPLIYSKKEKDNLSKVQDVNNIAKVEVDKPFFKNKIESILRVEPDINIDYISIANSETLDEYDEIIRGKILISVAVFFCGVRLIDNIFYNN